MGLYWPNFSLVFLIHLFLYAGVYCIENKVFQSQKQHEFSCQKFTYPLTRWQQPYIPEDSSQMLVPCRHRYFSSGEKTFPEVPMGPLLFDACSACCEGIILLAFGSIPAVPSRHGFGSIPAVPSRQRFSVLLTSGMACTRNTDEDLKGMQCLTETLQTYLWGQQVTRSGQQVEWMPKSQQP